MSWSNTQEHQNLNASGSYNSSSALAKEYDALEENASSRVDDEEGWREIHRDSPPKSAAEYKSMVSDYAKQGFDVKAIDMDGDNFTNANFAIKPSGKASNSTETYKQSEHLSTAKERVNNWENRFDEDGNDSWSTLDAKKTNNQSDKASAYLDDYKLNLREKNKQRQDKASQESM